jgi:RNA polymerase sigma-70 factor (ECF subfamily)
MSAPASTAGWEGFKGRGFGVSKVEEFEELRPLLFSIA